VQDGRIYIEKINGPFLFELKGTPAEYKAGLDCAIAKGWLELHLCPLHRRRCSTVRLKLRPFDREQNRGWRTQIRRSRRPSKPPNSSRETGLAKEIGRPRYSPPARGRFVRPGLGEGADIFFTF
jgi:hypothetical protein